MYYAIKENEGAYPSLALDNQSFKPSKHAAHSAASPPSHDPPRNKLRQTASASCVSLVYDPFGLIACVWGLGRQPVAKART
jgi:hypothetical protein